MRIPLNLKLAVPQKRHGQALVPVLFVLMILTTVAVSFAVSARSELRATANFSARTQRFFAARGALMYAMSALAQTSNNGAMYGIVPLDPEADSNGWWQVGDAWVKLEVVDTGSRLDLNSVTAATLNTWPNFQTNTDMASAIVSWRTPQPASGSGGTTGGTGSTTSGSSNSSSSTDPYASYYQGLTPPYNEKYAPYETVNELLLVEYMTPSILYSTMSGQTATTELTNPTSSTTTRGVGRGGPLGRAASRQAAGGGTAGGAGAGAGAGATTGAGASSQSAANDFSSIYQESTIPMSELFTTISRERQISVTGVPRVNITSASATDLENAGLTTTQAQAIVRYRQQASGGGNAQGGVSVAPITSDGGAAPATGIKSVRASRQAGGMPGGAGMGGGYGGGRPGGGSGPGSAKPGSGITGGGAGGTGGNTIKSPADLLAGGLSLTDLQQIADLLAIDSNTYREHVVNINTAPQEVLASIPGMDTTTLNAITTAQQSGQTFQSANDIYTLQGVSTAEFRAVMPYLTAKTSTYIIRIKVRMPGEDALYAVEALIELTDNGPLVLQWREVPPTPGWTSWTAPPPTLTQATGQSSSSTTSN